MTQTLPDILVSANWQDLTVTRPSLINTEAVLQVQGTVPAAFVFGGVDAPAPDMSGTILEPLGDIRGVSDHVWCRALGGAALVTVALS